MKMSATHLAAAICLAACGAALPAGAAASWGTLSGMHDYTELFGLQPDATGGAYTVTMLESNAAGNVFHPGEQPAFTFQVENLTERPIRARGSVEVIRYAMLGRPGDQWWPELHRLEDVGSLGIEVDIEAKGWQNLTIEPKTPETKGGYGLAVDLGEHGRRYLTSYVRTFAPDLKRVQHPKQALESMPPEILARLGVQAIRYAVAYRPSDSRRYEEHIQRLDREFTAMHENMVTCVAEIGTGGEQQPLGRGRPHLDEKGVMLGGKQDLVWLPESDDDYEQFVYHLASNYGWPKGPITGLMLWNEPWEGLSISGWGADMLRYRELYKRMGDAVFRARREAGVDVLVGGCDSSSNTWDKLFPDGTDEFLSYLDFCSIHYQGLSAPVLYPEWQNRTHHKGPVLIWDTESWVANTDDRFAGVVASNRAAGYDRALGTLSRIAVSTLSHHRIAYDTIRTPEGPQKVERLIESRPLAAAYGAVQHFIGERDFGEILLKSGLPWVYVFEGLGGNADDGTVVVLGDIGALFGKKHPTHLRYTVRSLEEVKAKQELERQLAALPLDAAQERAELRERLHEPMPFTGASMSINASGGAFSLYDSYGNRAPTKAGKIAIPLSDKSSFLRADPERAGSFEKLLEALRKARVEGIEPLEMIPYDMTAPIERRPTMRLRLTSQRNRPITGTLSVALGDLEIEYPPRLSFAPREQKWVQVKVVGGEAAASNTYPLSLSFDAGRDGVAVHDEEMRVNWISRRTIRVDGALDDWRGALPQTINVSGEGGASFEQQMWLPFESFEPGEASGVATGYVAYDDEHFYFAAKIADDTPHPGTLRFAERDHDADFYPEVCYEPVVERRGRRAREQTGELRELRWPAGVRRFSYRRWPALPSGHKSVPVDNVLIGFNAIPLGEDGWMSHLPGRMPKFIWYKTTDYQYALNKVADEYGGGNEIWRLEAPGMPRKHFYPRQPKHRREGAVTDGALEVRYAAGTRIVECALPWSEIPHVKALLDAGERVKFSFRVNHDTGGPDMELARDRACAQGISNAFHPDWQRSWPNELEFAFERT
ncbi:MAG: hypothetical protein PVH68_13330 [Armatimonadota bacterium]|jgi:hypothetical protein